MTNFGERLRIRRESRDVSLEEISASTKIGKRYLEALENNDFDALPGGMFAKGYLRAYAEAIGVDPEPLLEEYLRERRDRGDGDPTEDERAAQEAAQAALNRLAGAIEGSPAESRRRRNRALVGGLVALIALAAVGWAAVRYLGPRQKETIPVEAMAEEPTLVEEAPPREEQPAVVEAVPEPAPSPPPEQPATEAPSMNGITIPESGVGTGVSNRQLVGRSDRFLEGTKVVFWTRVIGGSAGETFEHVWLRDGRQVWAIQLNIGGAHWRTQSRFTLRQGSAGPWTVEARDTGGRVLARASFTCEAAD